MNDPNSTQAGGSQEAWSKLADQFTQIGRQFRQHYERVSAANPPEAEKQGSVERAVAKAGKAIEDTARTIDQSVRDPQVRGDTGAAGSALLRAVGATLTELGAALQREGEPAQPETTPTSQAHTSEDTPAPAPPSTPKPAPPHASTPTPASAQDAPEAEPAAPQAPVEGKSDAS